MLVVFNQIKCDLEKSLSTTEERFVKSMKDNGFLFTYYPNEDVTKGSIDKISLKLKSKIVR